MSVSLFPPLAFISHCSSQTIEYEEDYEDVTVNQMLAPRSQESDATEILNNLLKEYDKKLRPDIGGNGHFTSSQMRMKLQTVNAKQCMQSQLMS